MKDTNNDTRYIGVDVGGTKMLAAVVDSGGAVHRRTRIPTPRDVDADGCVKTVSALIEKTMKDEGLSSKDIKGIGIAIPGVVSPREGRIVLTPNMSLSGTYIVPVLEEKFDVPVYIENDVNVGTLGEYCLGAAQGAKSVVGVFVGTGIGAGIVLNGTLIEGARNAAGELGHMVMKIGGPLCGCGNRGCLEALASRSAIERDIREAIENGRESIVSELTDGNLSVIKSKVIKRALKQDDALVTDIMRKASETLGYACLTLRHILDPEVIVLGGGVVEACSEFILPIVEQTVGLHAMPGSGMPVRIVPARLEDDAVMIGAVALVRMNENGHGTQTGEALFSTPAYAPVMLGKKDVTVGEETYKTDIYIRVNGKVKQRRIKRALKEHGTALAVGERELKKVCKGGPEVLYIGTGREESPQLQLTKRGKDYLESTGVEYHMQLTSDAIEAYNSAEGRKALLIHRGV